MLGMCFIGVISEITANRKSMNVTVVKNPDEKRAPANAGSAAHLVEICVEIIEESGTPFDPREVILVGDADTRDQLSNTCCLFSTELFVFEIDVVNNFGDGLKRLVVKVRCQHQDLECTPVANMGEVCVEHIEP
jgi:hypothetical protein